MCEREDSSRTVVVCVEITGDMVRVFSRSQSARRETVAKNVIRMFSTQGPPESSEEMEELVALFRSTMIEELPSFASEGGGKGSGKGSGKGETPAVTPSPTPETTPRETNKPLFGTIVSTEKANELCSEFGGKWYSIYGPPEATGVWLGSWSKIIRTYPKLNGQKKNTCEQAIRDVSSEDPENAIQKIIIRTAL